MSHGAPLFSAESEMLTRVQLKSHCDHITEIHCSFPNPSKVVTEILPRDLLGGNLVDFKNVSAQRVIRYLGKFQQMMTHVHFLARAICHHFVVSAFSGKQYL